MVTRHRPPHRRFSLTAAGLLLAGMALLLGGAGMVAELLPWG